MLGLAFAFLVTAALYASVGFGGGSTYTALLTLAGTDFQSLPAISLICNIIVVTGGAIRFIRAGAIRWSRLIPLIALSAPLAWLGGLTPIKQSTFTVVLAVSLLVAGILLLTQRERRTDNEPIRNNANAFDLFAGAASGYLAGLVGIGGGIFLAPILHLTRWGSPRTIAAASCMFILVNSISGLIGQFMKLGIAGGSTVITHYWPLAIAVFIGGQIGSFASLKLLSQTLIRRATAVLILYVAAQLLWKLLH